MNSALPPIIVSSHDVRRLEALLASPDRQAVLDATHELNDATRHLAEVSMNRSVRAALAGRNVDQM